VLQANKKYNGMLTCALRPAGIVGEKDRAGITDGLLQSAANAPDWQLHFQLGDGNNLFDCTYVGNIAFGLAVAAEALLLTSSRTDSGEPAPPDHEKIDGEAFNVTNDSPVYFWDLARYVWTLYGRTISMDKVWHMPEGLMLPIGALLELSTYITGRKTKMTRQTIKYASNTRYFSCEKLKRRCGYTPLMDLEEGLARSVKSFVLREREEKAGQGEKKVQ
jgi:sterol-4alpha-carboxylate 3-dehydrogenase (decarboxylating)